MQSQIVCSRCRTVLVYPSGAANVCCVVCNGMTPVPPAEMEMGQFLCGGCHMFLTHAWRANSIQCSCCHTVNILPGMSTLGPNNIAHVNCASCQTILMYPTGAPLIKCAICNFITNTGGNVVPIFLSGNSGPASVPSTSMASTCPQNETVVVHNPMTVDANGKLVRNVVVGVTT